MNKDILQLQKWLNSKGASILEDGLYGENTRLSILNTMTNKNASKVSDEQLDKLAQNLGCSKKQLIAVSKVESSGSAYDDQGRPKILFERHWFHRLTKGIHGTNNFSNPDSGGYRESSWDKLTAACQKDPEAAFSSVSWGKFQVMGFHYEKLKFKTPMDLAYATVESEYGSYLLFAGFIENNNLKNALKKISPNPSDCEDFAKIYNGSGYRKFNYHEKIAKYMQ